MAQLYTYLALVAPGMKMTGVLVVLASVALLALLTPYAWRSAMRHHDEALDREHAAADVEETTETNETNETTDACVKEMAR